MFGQGVSRKVDDSNRDTMELEALHDGVELTCYYYNDVWIGSYWVSNWTLRSRKAIDTPMEMFWLRVGGPVQGDREIMPGARLSYFMDHDHRKRGKRLLQDPMQPKWTFISTENIRKYLRDDTFSELFRSEPIDYRLIVYREGWAWSGIGTVKTSFSLGKWSIGCMWFGPGSLYYTSKFITQRFLERSYPTPSSFLSYSSGSETLSK